MARGRPSKKSKTERRDDLLKVIRRTGFTGFEVLQILIDWYGWQAIDVTPATRVLKFRVTPQSTTDELLDPKPFKEAAEGVEV